MRNRCDECVTNKQFCEKCSENPDVPHQSFFQAYHPTCPIGEYGCIHDPAYTNLRDPKWYITLYGDVEPEEAMRQHPCYDDDEDYGCTNYDDEDK